MKDENNLVKQLASCEIMGGATNICSDKTGTLTQNKMAVTTLYIEDNKLVNREILPNKIRPELAKILIEAICANSSAIPCINKDTK